MQQISSKENNLSKHIIKLKNKKYRNKYNEYLVEGIKLLEEAIRENKNIKNIIVEENIWKSELLKNDLKEYLIKFDYIQVNTNIFKLISDVETPQGILAIIEKENNTENINFSEELIIALDNIQDPGNLGTIIRTADSAGLSQILVSKGTTDCYNSKVIRATMGAIFRVKIIECENLAETLKKAKKYNYKITITSLDTTKSIYDVDMNKNVIIMRK